MATQPALTPIEQYLRTSYSPDVDFVDGVIEERKWGEFAHARLQFLLAAIIATHEPEWSVIGVIEQRIRVANGRVRICDVSMLRATEPSEAGAGRLPLHGCGARLVDRPAAPRLVHLRHPRPARTRRPTYHCKNDD